VNTPRSTSRSALTAGLFLATMALGSAPAMAQTSNRPANAPERNTVMTMQTDLANRSADIHWPDGFNPATADLFSHNQLVIDASCERVWGHIIDATKWPEWYPNSKNVRINGGGAVLTQSSTFLWTTFGLGLESRINEFVPYTRIGWFGSAPGTAPSFYHTWYLVPQGASCLVVTDEVGMGADAAHLRQTDEGLMHRGHDLWLATLKWVAEGK
jgi:hypothetical protein